MDFTEHDLGVATQIAVGLVAAGYVVLCVWKCLFDSVQRKRRRPR